MARSTESGRVKTWNTRINAANKAYEKWSKHFNVKRLEEYYEGKQWRGRTNEEADNLYVINQVYSTVEVNKPSLIFHAPQVRVLPRPARGGTLGSDSESRARLCQDTIQTFIDDPDVGFVLETSLALHEAHFKFGVIEVGYSAESVENPRAGRPVLKEDKETIVRREPRAGNAETDEGEEDGEGTPVLDSQGQPVLEPDYRIRDEHLFVRRIPAADFRVSASSYNALDRNDWVAYREWHYLEDLKASKVYRNTADLKAGGIVEDGAVNNDQVDKEDVEKHAGMARVWKIWDLRTRKRHVIADGHNKFLLEDEPFTHLPLTAFKFHEKLDSFYPMPPVSQWLGPQDELNETREAQRAHRRRFYRRYTVTKGAVDSTEMDKFETGGDGVIVEVNVPNSIVPVPDAPMGSDVWNHLGETKQDLISVTGVSMDQRSVADSETATQATIIDARAKIRESSARTLVGTWLGQVCRLVLLTVREKMSLPFWIARNVDPYSPEAPNAAIGVAKLWQEITADDTGDTDLDVTVDLASMSPVSEEAYRNSWNQVIALLANPAVMQVMAVSPALLRKTINLYGIRAENDVQEILRAVATIVGMAQQQAQMQAQQQAAEQASKAGVAPELIAEAGAGGAGPGGPQGVTLPDAVSKAINTGGGAN